MMFTDHPLVLVFAVAVAAPLLAEIPIGVWVPTFLLLLLFLAHWVPVFFYRGELTRPERLPFALYTSVASLGLILVITRIGVTAKHMNPDIAQALVASGLLSLLVYPILAGILLSRAAPQARKADSG